MMNFKIIIKYATTSLKLWLVMVAGLSILCPTLAAHAGSSITLKQTAVIEGSTIQLGDIFDGLDADTTKSQKVLGAAPRPGKDMVLNARTLLRIALATDINWRPGTSSDHIVVKRAATIIEADDIKTGIADKIAQEGISGTYKITLLNNDVNIILPPDHARNFDVKFIDIKQDRRRFEATLVAPSLENPLRTTQVSGIMERLTRVPVLKNTIRSGSVIRASDIEFIEIQESKLSQTVALDIETAIGQTPRRIMRAGRTISINDLIAPRAVERGKTVTMSYQSGALQLTAQGKALENGAKGDVIRVSNLGSGKTVDAVIIGNGTVSVKTF